MCSLFESSKSSGRQLRVLLSTADTRTDTENVWNSHRCTGKKIIVSAKTSDDGNMRNVRATPQTKTVSRTENSELGRWRAAWCEPENSILVRFSGSPTQTVGAHRRQRDEPWQWCGREISSAIIRQHCWRKSQSQSPQYIRSCLS